MSDINLGPFDLTGVLAMLGAWVLAALFFVAAAVFVVISLRTGKREIWGRRVVVSLGLSIAFLLAGFGLLHLGRRVRELLDSRVVVWSIGVFAAGVYLCVVAGRRRAGPPPDVGRTNAHED